MLISEIQNYILDRKCPICDGQIRISLSDIIQAKVIICATCHAEIRAVNADAIAAEARGKLEAITKEIQNLMHDLQLESHNP